MYNIFMEEFVMPTEAMLLNSNVEDIEERLPTVVFCIKGQTFTQGFFLSWTKFILFLNENKLFNVRVMNYDESNSFDARNILVGANKGKGRIQSVFEDEIVYDFIFFLDTNINFQPMDIINILGKLAKVDELEVLAGIYPTNNGTPYVYQDVSIECLRENGSYKFTDMDTLIETGSMGSLNLVSVPATGMGFMAIKRGVLEKLTYPWFEPYVVQDEDILEYDNDEISFCKKLAELNISVRVDSSVILSKDNLKSTLVNR